MPSSRIGCEKETCDRCIAVLIASGSVITEDVPAEAVTLVRAKQVNKAGLATKLLERLRAIKAAKGKS